MTATPIPRTAAMVIFGDLDLTTLDELPAGPPARSRPSGCPATRRSGEATAWDRVRDEVAAGHRAFVVCPLVERLAAGRGQVGHRGVRAAGGRRAGGAARRAHARPDGARRPRGGDGPLPRRASSRCWWPPRSSRSASTSPRPPSWSSRAPTASGSPSCTSCGAGSAGAATPSWCYLLGGEEGNERLTAVAGVDRRVRAGRGGPAAARRGDPAGRPPEGAERPAAGLAERRRRHGAARRGAPGGRDHGRRGPAARRRTRTWPTRSGCS